jgi:peptide/nickel transport system permease protein
MRQVSLLAILALVAVASWIAARPNASYSAQHRELPSSRASADHPAGTDQLGRDRLTRVAVATLIGLAGASSAAVATTVIAALVGSVAALSPAVIAAPLLLACDVFLALPWLFLLMMVRTGMPLQTAPLVSAAITFLVLALLGWPACARAVHAGVLALRNADWMIQARAGGLRTSRLITRHMLPQIGPLLVPQFLISVPAFLMAEANLGTLGLGVSEPLPSWGSMLLELDNSVMLAGSPWIYFPIVVLILFLVLLELLFMEA